ncbi:MAG: glycoside hydrolase family 65 protein [Ruminococcaceae bacterium]|nr:glycoside hydrolase family 65 protein [Oscillospiraceae bacterium]
MFTNDNHKIVYNRGVGENKNWILGEDQLSVQRLAKCESIMCQGNGYLCMRGGLFEAPSEDVGPVTMIAGTFNRGVDDGCTMLINSANPLSAVVIINGEKMGYDNIDYTTHERDLNLKNGLLERKTHWKGTDGGEYLCEEKRFVSLKDRHLAAQKITVTALSGDCEITLSAGINGAEELQRINHHIDSVNEKAENGLLCVNTVTNQSAIRIATAAAVKFCVHKNGEKESVSDIRYETREKCASATVTVKLAKGESITLNKRISVFTSRDQGRDTMKMEDLSVLAENKVNAELDRCFCTLLKESEEEWGERIWNERDVTIDGADTDQLAVRFALYHLTAMSPVHDNRMNIAAKGLSGPGYYGHTFWDTEIYMLPYFIFAAPDEARSLIEYRYNCLEACRTHAKRTGFTGARFPWEAAWITDGEATPVIYNTGDYEVHITADVAFGVHYYNMVTGDEDFMEKCGYELLLDCARFWPSRIDYDAEKDQYVILNVIGANEYKENVDNNAYTNYMVHQNIRLAVEYTDMLRKDKPETYNRLNELLDLDSAYEKWTDILAKLYLPVENEDGIIPEDDTFLSLPKVTQNGISASLDPTVRERINEMGGFLKVMIGKQADVVALLYMMEDLFSPETKVKNFYFYEECCIHDSSLSLSTFSALAADLGEAKMAYDLFERATMIDMGNCMWSSNEGMHAASLGGIWQCAVLGFGGVRRYGNELRIDPHLPKAWRSVSFAIYWHGQRLEVYADHESLSVKNVTGTADVQFIHNGKICSVGEGITIER